MNLSTKQRAYLRSLAQSLRPQLHVGHEGYTAGTQSALEDLFKRRELVKVRLLNTTEEAPKEVAEVMGRAARAEVVGVVGKTFVLYRPNPDLKDPIELPEAGPPARSRPMSGGTLRRPSRGE
jgi:RNA-binding protein